MKIPEHESATACGHAGLEDICRMERLTRLIEVLTVLVFIAAAAIAVATLMVLRG